MSTIAQNLQALQQAKADIAEAITDMGGTVQSGDGLSDFAGAIMTIPAGGGTLEAKTVALDMSSGDQEVEASSGYDGLSKVTVTRPANLIHENIKNGENIGGILGTFSGTPIPNDLDGLVDGSITAFIMPAGKTSIKASLFDGNTGLLTADLTGATTIGNYAFRKCSNAAITLPSGLTNIGNYAFSGAGSTSSPMQLLATGANCSVGQYAFSAAKISKVRGTFGSIGNYAFNNCSLITEIDISCTSVGESVFNNNSTPQYTKLHAVINGSIGNNAFRYADVVNDFYISGVITSLGTYTFSQLGCSRSNPSQNPFTMDFRSSTFTSVPDYCFYGLNATNGLKYMQIYLPSTCASLGNYAFNYLQNSDIFYTRATAPTIQSYTFYNASNIRHFVPYGSVTTYRTATNWAAQAAAIYGWAPENTFSQGDTLPTVTADYYGITWYSDKAMTQQVTTVTDPTAPLYCSVGTTVLYYEVGTITTLDCTVTISDGTNTYTTGDLVATGTILTISTAGTDPTKPAVYMLDINGTDYAPAASETMTVAGDISITALYWDEVNPPYEATLNDNSWTVIKEAVEGGYAPSAWLGQTKTDTNGNHWQCVDMKAGRYTKAGGGTTNAVFMRVEPYTDYTAWSTARTISYNGSGCYLREKMQSGGAYFTTEDQVLAALVDGDKINVLSSSNNASINTATVGFFSPCYNEMGFTGIYGYASSSETVNNGTTFGAYEYFSANQSYLKRIKYRSGSAISWWLRSRVDGTTASMIKESGEGSSANFNYGKYAVPCFAW